MLMMMTERAVSHQVLQALNWQQHVSYLYHASACYLCAPRSAPDSTIATATSCHLLIAITYYSRLLLLL
jgi:hypothetical protein